MKQFFTLLIAMLTLPVWAVAQGWPANYGGVMLQGFYWDSYTDTQWTKLEAQADDLSPYFSLIWVPQSGYCNTLTNQMGYAPIWWFDHKSAFGTETQLRSMIQTFKAKGTGIIEDVVINHRNGNTNWCDFPTETWKGKTSTWTLADICKGDDGGKTEAQGYHLTGATDTGDDFDGARDIDHTSLNAQKNIKTYLDFLLNDLGYTGFRYDMVKGYAAKFIGIYNGSAKPQFSVGEYWDNAASIKSWINGTQVDGTPTSAAFDFPMKYAINEALGNGQWNRLAETALANDAAYSRYAVTFVDNHDTGRSSSDGGAPLYANIAAANAYILAMPGTPCIFLSHWKAHKTIIKKLITARRAAGVTNQSSILGATAQAGGFVLTTQGTVGKVLLLLGTTTGVNTSGYQLAVEGENFKYYVSDHVDISAIGKIKDDTQTFAAPDFCQVDKGETCAFFEAPAGWTQTVYCWRWDNTHNYTGNHWPGVACTRVGTTATGKAVWKWSWNKTSIASPASNAGIIFSNNGSPQTANLAFTNGGYYDLDGLKGTVKPTTTGIAADITTDHQGQTTNVYTVDGRLVRRNASATTPLQGLAKGVYIVDGKKYVVE